MKRKILIVLGALVCVVTAAAYAKVDRGAGKLKVVVITDKKCPFCDTDQAQAKIKAFFPQAVFVVQDYRAKDAQALIEKHSLDTLPVFLFDDAFRAQGNFKAFSSLVEEIGGAVLLKPEASGIFCFLKRPYTAGRIDYFLDFYDARVSSTFNVLLAFCRERKLDLDVHIVVPSKDVGGYPMQEVATALVIKKLYPDKFFDYLAQRLADIDSVDCTTSLLRLGLDNARVASVVVGKDAAALWADNAAWLKTFKITNGNAVLFNNRRLFMVMKAKKDDFARVINKQ